MVLRILYDMNATWEVDYIQEIFSKHQYIFTPLTNNDFENPEKYKSHENVIVVFSVNVIPYNIMEFFLKKLKPLGIVILSDEFGNINMFHQFYKYAKFTIRNYYHKNYDESDNVYHFPLGYNSGFLNKYSIDMEVKASSERKINWSFVGKIKNIERYNMIENFKKIDNYYIDDNLETYKMLKIYSNSCFVPNAKGNCNLDCFRLYEASICGAIPVVVCDNDETWKKMNDPPWIFAKTWAEAIEKCNNLLQNKNELNERQLQIINWWRQSMSDLQFFISKYVSSN